jgi:hypothetical protein
MFFAKSTKGGFMSIKSVADLVGVNLTRAGFKIREATEVYEVNNHEEKTRTVGYFNDEKKAHAFVEKTNYCRCAKIKILTDGKKIFIVSGAPSFFADEIEIDLKRLNDLIEQGLAEC